MAESRHEHDVAEVISEWDEDARRMQAQDAARIHQELADTNRIAAHIDALLADN